MRNLTILMITHLQLAVSEFVFDYALYNSTDVDFDGLDEMAFMSNRSRINSCSRGWSHISLDGLLAGSSLYKVNVWNTTLDTNI